MSWAEELMRGAFEDYERKQRKGFAAIEAALGSKVICAACGCTVADFGEKCGGPNAPEILETGMACEGIAAIFDAATAKRELTAWSFIARRRVLDRSRLRFTFGPAPD